MSYILNIPSNFSYYTLLGFQRAQPDYGSLTIELYTAVASGTPDLRSNFTPAAFTGYAPQLMNLNSSIYDDAPISSLEMAFDAITFQLTGPHAPGYHIKGFFVYDSTDTIIFWNPFDGGDWIPVNIGDFLSLSIFMPCLYSYP